MARSGTRSARQVTSSVLRWYFELADSSIMNSDSDNSVVNYRIDVDRAMATLSDAERAVMLYVHRDGLYAKDAIKLSGVTHTRPDEYVTATEVKLGRELMKRQLDDLVQYLL
jgi:DNA-directed RNA polymerase specialized sigma24 family protein